MCSLTETPLVRIVIIKTDLGSCSKPVATTPESFCVVSVCTGIRSTMSETYEVITYSLEFNRVQYLVPARLDLEQYDLQVWQHSMFEINVQSVKSLVVLCCNRLNLTRGLGSSLLFINTANISMKLQVAGIHRIICQQVAKY